MLNADAKDPTDPTDKKEPTDPMDRTDPRDPIDRKESWDHSDHFDDCFIGPIFHAWAITGWRTPLGRPSGAPASPDDGAVPPTRHSPRSQPLPVISAPRASRREGSLGSPGWPGSARAPGAAGQRRRRPRATRVCRSRPAGPIDGNILPTRPMQNVKSGYSNREV